MESIPPRWPGAPLRPVKPDGGQGVRKRRHGRLRGAARGGVGPGGFELRLGMKKFPPQKGEKMVRSCGYDLISRELLPYKRYVICMTII